jgi:hypothetical protein
VLFTESAGVVHGTRVVRGASVDHGTRAVRGARVVVRRASVWLFSSVALLGKNALINIF